MQITLCILIYVFLIKISKNISRQVLVIDHTSRICTCVAAFRHSNLTDGELDQLDTAASGTEPWSPANYVKIVRKTFWDQPEKYASFETSLFALKTEPITSAIMARCAAELATLFAPYENLVQSLSSFLSAVRSSTHDPHAGLATACIWYNFGTFQCVVLIHLSETVYKCLKL